MNDINDIFGSLTTHIDNLQENLRKMNQSIVETNEKHESLKTDMQQNLDIQLHDDLNNQIISMTETINQHMAQAEQMINHIMDEERLSYMSNMTLLQNQMMKGKQ